jgi:hypothetical protein
LNNQILLNKISHQFIKKTKLSKGWNILPSKQSGDGNHSKTNTISNPSKQQAKWLSLQRHLCSTKNNQQDCELTKASASI